MNGEHCELDISNQIKGVKVLNNNVNKVNSMAVSDTSPYLQRESVVETSKVTQRTSENVENIQVDVSLITPDSSLKEKIL